METSLPPSQVTAAGPPDKKVVGARQLPEPRLQRPRTAKRLFLAFCILFAIVVVGFIIGGN